MNTHIARGSTLRVPPAALTANALSIAFRQRSGSLVPVVDDVSFTLRRGHVTGLVGESGSGKSITSLAIIGLLPPGAEVTAGSVLLHSSEQPHVDSQSKPPVDRSPSSPSRSTSIELTTCTPKQRERIQGRRVSMVLQEPSRALNPAYTIDQHFAEMMGHHLGLSRRSIRTSAVAQLGDVGLSNPDRVLDHYPFELSGGMLQRVLIALALSCNPAVLLADEPTTALDVRVQAQVLDLLRRLTDERGLATLFVTHNLAVVNTVCDEVAVMYAGQVVESGAVDEVLDRPQHPYTKALLGAVPSVGHRSVLKVLTGTPPAPGAWGDGCRFGDRCTHRAVDCDAPPAQRAVGDGGVVLRCHQPWAQERQ